MQWKMNEETPMIEVGIDEAGRGCLMGRVYVAAVILPDDIPADDSLWW